MLAAALASLVLVSAGGDAEIPPAPLSANAEPLRAELLKWRATPKGADFLRVFPRRAMQEDVAGAAELLCHIGPRNHLADCAVQTEQPQGYGFGDAASELGPSFEVAPGQEPAVHEGATVFLKLRFNLPRR